MTVSSPPQTAPGIDCPYLPDRTFVRRYFFGDGADADEAAAVQAAGWRRFGTFFFRPDCPGCRACVPVRLDAAALQLSASQRRVWRRNQDVEFSVQPLADRDDYFDLYRRHSRDRFGKTSDRDEFRDAFTHAAVPSFVTEYRIGGELAGLGFCDRGADGLSSVYFCFDSRWAERSLGIYSVLRECAWAAGQGLRWYYLGYWVQGNATMAYKGRFAPRQVLDWDSGLWSPLAVSIV